MAWFDWTLGITYSGASGIGCVSGSQNVSVRLACIAMRAAARSVSSRLSRGSRITPSVIAGGSCAYGSASSWARKSRLAAAIGFSVPSERKNPYWLPMLFQSYGA